MRNQRSKLTFATLLVLLSLGLVQCSSEKTLSTEVDVNLVTNAPLVRTTERTVNSSTISPNWFDLRMQVSNKSEYRVRIEEVLVYVTVDGTESGPHTFDIGLLNETDDNSGETWEYNDFCTYPAATGGSSQTFALSACANNYTGIPDPSLSGVGRLVKPLTLYIGDIPKPADATSLAFSARAELHGVFLDSSGIDKERFLKTIFFTTR